jgi:hypothetical protein
MAAQTGLDQKDNASLSDSDLPSRPAPAETTAIGQPLSPLTEEKQNAANGEASSSTTVQQPVDDNYPHGLPLVLIFIGLFFGALCVGLVSSPTQIRRRGNGDLTTSIF